MQIGRLLISFLLFLCIGNSFATEYTIELTLINTLTFMDWDIRGLDYCTWNGQTALCLIDGDNDILRIVRASDGYPLFEMSLGPNNYPWGVCIPGYMDFHVSQQVTGPDIFRYYQGSVTSYSSPAGNDQGMDFDGQYIYQINGNSEVVVFSPGGSSYGEIDLGSTVLTCRGLSLLPIPGYSLEGLIVAKSEYLCVYSRSTMLTADKIEIVDLPMYVNNVDGVTYAYNGNNHLFVSYSTSSSYAHYIAEIEIEFIPLSLTNETWAGIKSAY